MLFNVSYNDEKIKNKINSLVGDSFSLMERLKKGGIGSGKLIITKADKEIENLLILDKNINYCNIEKRKNGIIIIHRKKGGLDTYPKKFKIIDTKNYGLSTFVFGRKSN